MILVLGWPFYKCLAELDPKDFRVYGDIKQDPQFIQQLIELLPRDDQSSDEFFGLGEFDG